MRSVSWTWTETSKPIVVYGDRTVVRRAKDDSCTMIVIDGVQYTVLEPMEEVVAGFDAL